MFFSPLQEFIIVQFELNCDFSYYVPILCKYYLIHSNFNYLSPIEKHFDLEGGNSLWGGDDPNISCDYYYK